VIGLLAVEILVAARRKVGTAEAAVLTALLTLGGLLPDISGRALGLDGAYIAASGRLDDGGLLAGEKREHCYIYRRLFF